jgi:hypothetical protein
MGRVLEAEPSDAALGRIQSAIRELDNDRAIEQSTVGERASILGRYWDDARGWYARQREGGGFERYLIRPYITRRLITSVEILNGLIAVARRPWPDRIEIDVPQQPPMTGASGYPFSGGPLPAQHVEYTMRHSYRARASAVANALALGRTADAAIGVSRYQRATGSLPGSLG